MTDDSDVWRFDIPPHFIDSICKKCNHGKDVPPAPLPDGWDVLFFTDGTNEYFASETSTLTSNDQGVTVHDNNDRDVHEFHPWHVIQKVVSRDSSAEFYKAFNDWFAEVHGLSLKENIEMAVRGQNIQTMEAFRAIWEGHND